MRGDPWIIGALRIKVWHIGGLQGDTGRVATRELGDDGVKS